MNYAFKKFFDMFEFIKKNLANTNGGSEISLPFVESQLHMSRCPKYLLDSQWNILNSYLLKIFKEMGYMLTHCRNTIPYVVLSKILRMFEALW